jgi:hypothetical protein
MDILVTRHNQTLVPFDELAEDAISGLSSTKPYMVKLVKSRSVKHNRLYFRCIASIIKYGGFEGTRDELHHLTKLEAGCVKLVQLNGITFRIADSTAFDKMDQPAFNEYFDKAFIFWTQQGLTDYIEPQLLAKVNA